MTKPFLLVQNLVKRYEQKNQPPLTVFENINFSIEKGEFICTIGHSGCGKSTIMNALSGLDRPTDGVVIMDGSEVRGPSLDRGVVFQNYSLLPWLGVLDNIRFAVRARWPHWNRDQVTQHSKLYLDMVGLNGVDHRKPSQLSGGMRQRVSIARAFSTQPKLLLLDEPFGALDALTRGVIQDELVKICAKTRQTVFMITHDVDEAMLLSDRILLMSNGPRAVIAESVTVDLPKPRRRGDIIKHPDYYRQRNHLVDFLVNRSAAVDYQTDSQSSSQTASTSTAALDQHPISPPTRSVTA